MHGIMKVVKNNGNRPLRFFLQFVEESAEDYLRVRRGRVERIEDFPDPATESGTYFFDPGGQI
jgi:hypothetical protein